MSTGIIVLVQYVCLKVSCQYYFYNLFTKIHVYPEYCFTCTLYIYYVAIIYQHGAVSAGQSDLLTSNCSVMGKQK